MPNAVVGKARIEEINPLPGWDYSNGFTTDRRWRGLLVDVEQLAIRALFAGGVLRWRIEEDQLPFWLLIVTYAGHPKAGDPLGPGPDPDSQIQTIWSLVGNVLQFD